MTYFRELPDVEYQNFLSDTTGSLDYIKIKNLFIRGKLRDDLQNVFTVFDKYVILEDERPDQIADKLYGDPSLDWVIRVTANIISYQNDLPLSAQELYNYCVEKYGVDRMLDVRYYETTAVKDQNGKEVLPAGLVVDQSFTIPNPDLPQLTINPVTAITNFDYETERNDEKKTIYVLKPSYLGQFLDDMRDIATYGFNSEFIDDKTIRVTNTLNTSP